MTIRAFIAVDIGARPELVEIESALDNIGADLKMVEPENIHITLKFLGDTDEGIIDDIIGIIQDCTTETEPFNLELKGTGAFPNLNYIKVLWIGLENYEPLVPLTKKLNARLVELGFKADGRAFKPHVTLARVKTRKKKNRIKELLINNQSTSFGILPVTAIQLKKSVLDSKGPTYYTLAEITLGKTRFKFSG
jgi:2'-5' RNA ligase